MLRPNTLAVLVLALSIALTPPSAEGRSLIFEPVLTDLGPDAVAVAHADDDRLFIVMKDGRVLVVVDGEILDRPYLDIRDRVFYTGEPDSEQGLLALAFHPDYQSNGYLYVAYTNNDRDGILARFSVSGPDPNHASSGSEFVMLTVPQPGPNHNLNYLTFGPDGYLYLSSGDGGYRRDPRCTPQDGGSYLGKILRFDVDQNVDEPPYYGIPFDNPFLGDAGTLDEIWALGLRNAWRFTFDALTGDAYIADVGHDNIEELNFQPASSPGGENYGFKMMEGNTCLGSQTGCVEPIPPCFDPAYTPPILDYRHNQNRCAIIGGYVYRGEAIPELYGQYLHGDFCGAMGLVRLEGETWVREELTNVMPGMVSFFADPDDELYVLATGTLYRITGFGEAGGLSFAMAGYNVAEDDGPATIAVRRTDGGDGAVGVSYATADGTAQAGADYTGVAGTLAWADGDTAEKTFQVPVSDDGLLEGAETVELTLSNPTGGALLGTPAMAELVILDDELTPEPCIADATTLCLNQGRFRVSVDWRNFEGETGVGNRVLAGTDDSGLFWFFDDENWEFLVKVIDGCDFNNHFWVFAAATTNVEYTLRVLDTQTGVLREYPNTLGVSAPATTDNRAFATCP